MLGAITILIALLSDQITKYVATFKLGAGNSISIIGETLFFTYVENKGVAFGMFQNSNKLLVILITAILVIVFYNIPKVRIMHSTVYIATCMVAGGALGNLVDRLRLGYVVDFIDFRFGEFHYPVFNIADCFVVIGTFVLIFYVLFDTKKAEREECGDGNV